LRFQVSSAAAAAELGVTKTHGYEGVTEVPPLLERILVVALLVVFIAFGAFGALRAILRRSISTSGQDVSPSSFDFWSYLLGYVFLCGMGVCGLVKYFNLIE
jgi:hypothetical protein